MWSVSTVYFSGGLAGGEGAPWADNVSTAGGPSSGGLDGESAFFPELALGRARSASSMEPGTCQGSRWIDRPKLFAFTVFVPSARHCGRTRARTEDVARLGCSVIH